MKGSYLADEIDREYKRRKYYENKTKREKCKDKECQECKYTEVCTSYEVEND